MSSAATPLRHPLLDRLGVEHGFGVRGAPAPRRVLRPRQVHGARVARLERGGHLSAEEADAVVSGMPGVAVAVVTADCVPILACSEDGALVAAIHAGWRGLACGVVAAAVEALLVRLKPEQRLYAVIGPHIGACCYEVDEPVTSALRARFGAALDGALRETRPGHARLALSSLARAELASGGVGFECQGDFTDACTYCDADRFHSYRRDGARAGRLLHHIAASGSKRAGANEG